NSQPWSVYAAAGATLARIRDVWRAKYAAKAKGSPDMPTGHRTNFSARSQQCMASFMAVWPTSPATRSWRPSSAPTSGSSTLPALSTSP
ncbi:MAG: hypothetical protein IIY31_05290, partial [Desulfovibrio sp.]|nr:hypothetical protein [Desulfovibrio sp.]